MIESEFIDCSPGVACAEKGVYCHDRIEVDMQLAVDSQGGALAERWVGALTLIDTRDPDVVGPDPGDQSKAEYFRSNYEITGKLSLGMLNCEPAPAAYGLNGIRK